MRQFVTTGIILARTNFGEADRILTVITPDHGKLRLMAKGVRKVKSKLAGGIELFSVSNITYIPGRREIGTLISTRLVTHYSHIVASLDRTTVGYEFLKLINKSTQDECGPEFYELLVLGFSNLNDLHEFQGLVEVWFLMRLLKNLGHEPNLKTDVNGQKLDRNGTYLFDHEAMGFVPEPTGQFTANHIKLMRLLLTQTPDKLQVIQEVGQAASEIRPILTFAMQQSISR